MDPDTEVNELLGRRVLPSVRLFYSSAARHKVELHNSAGIETKQVTSTAIRVLSEACTRALGLHQMRGRGVGRDGNGSRLGSPAVGTEHDGSVARIWVTETITDTLAERASVEVKNVIAVEAIQKFVRIAVDAHRGIHRVKTLAHGAQCFGRTIARVSVSLLLAFNADRDAMRIGLLVRGDGCAVLFAALLRRARVVSVGRIGGAAEPDVVVNLRGMRHPLHLLALAFAKADAVALKAVAVDRDEPREALLKYLKRLGDDKHIVLQAAPATREAVLAQRCLRFPYPLCQSENTGVIQGTVDDNVRDGGILCALNPKVTQTDTGCLRWVDKAGTDPALLGTVVVISVVGFKETAGILVTLQSAADAGWLDDLDRVDGGVEQGAERLLLVSS